MGYYINKDSKGNYIGTFFVEKVVNLLDDNAEIIDPPAKWEEGLVCVVNNGNFAAAAYASDERDMNRFLRPDSRPKQWLRKKDAKELSAD